VCIMRCESKEMLDFKVYASGDTLEVNFDLQACCKESALELADELCGDLHLDNVIEVEA